MNARSEHKILESILIQLGHVIPENKHTDYLAQKSQKKVEKGTIVCLDEADQIKGERILETLASHLSGLVLKTNRGVFFDTLDSKISSRLFAAEIEFRQRYANTSAKVSTVRLAVNLLGAGRAHVVGKGHGRS